VLLAAAAGVLMLLPLGTLLGLTTDVFSFTTVGTRTKATRASLLVLRNALTRYQMTYNAYPRSLSQLYGSGMVAPQSNAMVDGWNVSFTYSTNTGTPGRPYILISGGPNRTLGDSDDIDVWDLPP
jgi:hypothetical protein